MNKGDGNMRQGAKRSYVPKRLAGCKGCIYFNFKSLVCDYRHITGKLRTTQNAPLLDGGGCRLKEEGYKPYIGFNGSTVVRYRVVLPDGKVRLMNKEQLEEYEREKEHEDS